MIDQITEGIHCVGVQDWNIRDFHGYKTFKGSSYNAYLIEDEKNVLVDTVKLPFKDVLIKNVETVMPFSKIDYVVVNHVEPDHCGSLVEIMKLCPQATIVINHKGQANLQKLYKCDPDWKYHIVKTPRDSLCIGKRTLTFIYTMLLHWPESMMTYCAEEKLLFSMDGFGQHYASTSRFDDAVEWPILKSLQQEYYGNIVAPFTRQTLKLFKDVAGLEIETIAPAHGLIIRKYLAEVLALYQSYGKGETEKKATIFYDTMYQSTEKMAHQVCEGILSRDRDIEVVVLNLRAATITDVAANLLTSRAFAVGSPTLNMGMMPLVAGALTYATGLKLIQKKPAAAFGSFGWERSGPRAIGDWLKREKCDLVASPVSIMFAPTEEILQECYELGAKLGNRILGIKEEAEEEK